MIKQFVDLYYLRKNLHLSIDELEDLRNRKIRTVIERAYHHVPYYKKLFNDNGINPHDIKTVDDVKLIPITTKEDLLEAGVEQLVADDVSTESVHNIHTSGSTGKPLLVKLTNSDMRTRKLMEPRAMLEMGLSLMDKRVCLGPRPDSKKQRFYQAIDKYLPVEDIIEQLKKKNPSVLYVYPKLLNTILNHTGGQFDEVCRPRLLITAREKMEEMLLGSLKEQFDFEHFNIYGSRECGILGWECKSHRGLHVNDDQVLLEISPLDEAIQHDDSSVGEVIITTLNNQAMPFIRYRQGDLAKTIKGRCGCGSNFSMISQVEGRASELLYLPSGRVLPAYYCAHIIRDTIEVFNNIRQFLTVQECRERIIIKLVPVRALNNNDLQHLKNRLLEVFAEQIEIEILLVEKIDSKDMKIKDFISFVN